MNPGSIRQFLRSLGIDKFFRGGFLVILTVTLIFSAYSYSVFVVERSDERIAGAEKRAALAKQDDRAQQLNHRLTNPTSGTTPESIAALSIGMTGEEVQNILNYRFSLGIEIFPYNHTYNGIDWVSNDIAIKGVGYVQAVFIKRQLVGLGSLNPDVGRVCGGCLEDMLRGDRLWERGLPYHVDKICPTCGSNKVVPYGARWAEYNTQKNICCNINVDKYPFER